MGLPKRPIQVSFYPYVDTKSTIRIRGQTTYIRISDHIHDAPLEIHEGAIRLLLSKLHGRALTHETIAGYRSYVRREELQQRRIESHQTRGRKHVDPVGKHRSLLASYLRVTMDYPMPLSYAPTLSWSRTVSRRRFGHYDAAHKCIVISQALDDAKVPEYVLDFVVYHELLHVLHPVQEGPRRRIHPPQFKRDEARFVQKDEAEAWLKRLTRGPTMLRRA